MSYRKCLHLVTDQGRGLYSLSRMDVSSLFYPSTAAAEAAEAKSRKKDAGINKPGMARSIRRLPGPSTSFRPYTPVVPNHYSLINVFALLGQRKDKIICSNELGNTVMYNTELNSFMSMPARNSLKSRKIMAVSIPSSAADATTTTEFANTDSLYILDMASATASASCFEVLSYNPDEVGNWTWFSLPLPPFFNDPEYKAPLYAPNYAVDGTRICVSTTNATYAFDTVTGDWSKVGDWVLPFKAEYVSELGLWLGLSDHEPYDLCAMESLSTAAPPAVQPVGKEFEPREGWSLLRRTMVNLGSRRLCIANGYEVITNKDNYDTVEVAVLTGVEVVPAESGLRLIKHKTKRFVASIPYVI